MDGGGRLLRSIGALLQGSFGAAPAVPFAHSPFTLAAAPRGFTPGPRTAGTFAPSLPARMWRRHRRLRSLFARLAASRFASGALIVGLLAGTGAYGFVRGGGYASFVAEEGTLPDVAARLAGFGIKSATVTGARGLTEPEVMALAGIGPRNSLPFLDVAAVRARLKSVPLIREASVSKLYPNRLQIEIEERQPSALWQKDGTVEIVAADGTPIDPIKDRRFAELPLVVGDGANARLPEYLDVLEAMGDLGRRVRAGLFVAGRRWTLKMDNDVEVALPEFKPAVAAARLASLEREGRVLEKAVLALDLRVPGRMIAHLTAEAAASRAEALARKSKKKGAA